LTGGSEEGLSAGADVSLEVDGETWTVSEEGGGRSGTGSDIGAALTLLRFSSSIPDRPAREILVGSSSLDAVGKDELCELFARARPRRAPPQEPGGGEEATDDSPVSE
jgi:hypothetical protein